MQAAVLRVKLKHLDEWTRERQKIADYYFRNIENGKIRLPKESGLDNVWHIFPVFCEHRDELQEYLREKGIMKQKHYPIPIPFQEAYKEYGHHRGAYPVSENLAAIELSLPLWIGMTKEDLDTVVDALNMY